MTANQINYWKNVETERHNRELEKQGLEQLRLKEAEIAETRRANVAREVENFRSNTAQEAETNRSNLAREQNNVLITANEIAKAQETARSNQAYESIGRTNASANLVQAAASTSQAATAAQNAATRQREQQETVRSNKSNEMIRSNSNPWTSIATTLNNIVPRVAEKVTTIVDNLKSIRYTPKTTIKSPVSTYGR